MKISQLFRVAVSSVLVVGLLFSMVGCGSGTASQTDSNGKTVVQIAYTKAGYGDEWLKAICEEYTKEHPDVTFDLQIDSGKLPTQLEAGRNVPDIAIFLGTNLWYSWAAKGYLEDLSSVFDSEVDGVKMEDKLIDGVQATAQYNGKEYFIPWSYGASGLVYNKKMFEEHGWSEPKTVDELYTLIEKIKEAGITPFAFGGKTISYWDSVFLPLWAQGEGEQGMEAFRAMESPEVYNTPARLNALKVIYDILSDPTNYVEGAMGMDHMQSQMVFLQGKAAMMPNGSHMENEMKTSMPEGFEMQIMLTPTIDGAKMENVSVVQNQDMIMVPARAKNKEAAKDFLLFMCSDKMLKLYTQKCGGLRPFKYTIEGVEGVTQFTQRVLDLCQMQKTVFLASENPMVFIGNYSYYPFFESPYARFVMKEDTPQSFFDYSQNMAKREWENTRVKIGLS